MSKSEPPKSAPAAGKIPVGMQYVLGGSAGMAAACIVQPLDLVKTRMQISGAGGGARQYKNSIDCMKSVIVNEGPLALYKGIGAGLLRQATYTTGRLGVYTNLNNYYRANYEGEPSLLVRLAMGMTAGAFGAFIGTPAEISLIRMTADGRLPPEQRRNYTNVVNALTRIVKEEGVLTLWRGCIATVTRAMVVNMAQLSSYSHIKQKIKTGFEMQEGLPLHFFSSMCSGFITTIASMPVDIAKTRIQNMKYKDGKPEYKGTIDVLTKLLRQEGVLALWKGLLPYYFRLGPHTVLMLMFLENLNQAYFKYVLGTTGRSGL